MRRVLLIFHTRNKEKKVNYSEIEVRGKPSPLVNAVRYFAHLKLICEFEVKSMDSKRETMKVGEPDIGMFSNCLMLKINSCRSGKTISTSWDSDLICQDAFKEFLGVRSIICKICVGRNEARSTDGSHLAESVADI